MSVVPLADLQAHLNMRAGANDELQRMLDAAEDHVAELCGPLTAGRLTVTAHASGENLVLPVLRLTDVTALRDPDGQPVTVAAGSVNLLSGIIRLPYHADGAWAADVLVGQPLPPAMSQAVLIIAAQLWETQRAASAGPTRPPGMGGEPTPVPMGVLVPRRAEMLMRPHLIPPAVA